MNSSQITITRRQLIGMIIALIIVFILGVTLTTVVNYNPSNHGVMQTSVLIAHIVVAVGLLIGGSIRLVLSLRWRSLRLASAIGLVSIVAAFANGSDAARSGSAVAVLFMALFFMTAFIAYGYSLLHLNASKTAR